MATILLRNSFDPNLERNGEALSEFILDDKYRRSNSRRFQESKRKFFYLKKHISLGTSGGSIQLS